MHVVEKMGDYPQIYGREHEVAAVDVTGAESFTLTLCDASRRQRQQHPAHVFGRRQAY